MGSLKIKLCSSILFDLFTNWLHKTINQRFFALIIIPAWSINRIRCIIKDCLVSINAWNSLFLVLHTSGCRLYTDIVVKLDIDII